MEPSAAQEPIPEVSFGALLRDMYLAPSDAFAHIARRPRHWAALTGFVIMQLTFLGVWLPRMDLVELARVQAEAAGQPAPPAGAMSESAIETIKWVMAVSGPAAAVVMLVFLAGVLLFVFNFLLGTGATFHATLGVTAWTAFALNVVVIPLMLLVMAMKGAWSLPPDRVLQANLGAFLDRDTVGKFVFTVAKSVDLFWAWTLFLVSAGMAQVSRRPVSTAATAVVTLYGLFTLVKAGLAAAF